MPDVVIIGGGIIGLATARALLDDSPRLSLTVLEKEPELAAHQTGRNSGVLHSGIYYAPGSLKARYAREGAEELYRLCAEYAIPAERCGKVIVATSRHELAQLDELEKRAVANRVEARRLSRGELREREPHVAGEAALLVRATGIVDFRGVSALFARLATERGAEIRTGTEAVELRETGRTITVVLSSGETIATRVLLNCAGLHSDRIARLAGLSPPAQILPFRGEYYEFTAARRHLVRDLIYPVPDPAVPFLGVHFTRDVEGGVHAGPNAVLALSREGYRRWQADRHDLYELGSFAGFWRLARTYWRTAVEEYHRSFSKAAFVRGLQRLLPDVTADDLVPAPAGIRAQAVRPDGRLVDDFLIRESPHSVHVLNAPSPAATASPMIGRHVAGLVRRRLAD